MPKSNLEYWNPKLERNRQRDAENIDVLQKNGWRVIVVRECELRKSLRDERLAKLYNEITAAITLKSIENATAESDGCEDKR